MKDEDSVAHSYKLRGFYTTLLENTALLDHNTAQKLKGVHNLVLHPSQELETKMCVP
jgi:hypothetical protein